MADILNEAGNGSDDTIVSTEPLSIRDSLKASMKADTPDTSVETDTQKADRARDEAGRFAVKTDAKPDATVATPVAPAAKIADAAAVVATPAVAVPDATVAQTPAVPAVKAPPGWAPEAKADFANLPVHVQAAIGKREQEVENGFKVLQDYKGLEEFSPIIKQAGKTHAEVMRNALDWEASLQRDPWNTIANVANVIHARTNLPVDQILHPSLVTFLGQQAQQPQQQRQVPQQQPIDVESTVEQVLRKREIENQISAFYSDPANVHVEAVSEDMAALIKSGRAASIKDAYDAACWMNPNIRQQLISQAAPAPAPAVPDPQIAQNAQRAAAADQARKASRSVTGSSAPGPSQGLKPGAPSSIRDSLKEAFASADGRV